ncbi:MAG: hypothetical protein R6W06_05805 [Prochlorococcaceae cyanobacterium]
MPHLRPWTETHLPWRNGRPERYALRAGGADYLAIEGQDQRISHVSSSEGAWQFHTHQRAVQAARQIASVLGSPVDVVKLA